MEFPGYREKIFECRYCHFRGQFNLFQMGAAAQGGHGAGERPTHIVSQPNKPLDEGHLRVVRTNQVFPLAEGSNVVGRKAKSSTASIQIEGDEHMSRHNVEIRVEHSASGYEHHLVELNSMNPILLNGREVPHNIIVKMKFGDTLTLGKTEVVLESADDEATKLV